MSMPFPPRLRPLAVAAVALSLVACDRQTAQAPQPTTPPPAAPVATPTVVLAPALDRAGLLSNLSAEAANYAAGRIPSGADPLVGRQFAIRTAFGCGAPDARPAEAAGDGIARFGWDDAREALRLTLTPEDWSESALVGGAGDRHWEAVEGFWITRPWMTTEDCPVIRPDPLAGPSAASPQTVGLASVYGDGSSRLDRRNGRAFNYTVRSEGGAPPARPPEGWRVLMEGRIAAFPDGRAVRCRAPGPDQRPVCVVAVQMDRVAFSTADGAVLGEWRTG